MSIVQTLQTFESPQSLKSDPPCNAFTSLIGALSSRLGTSGIDADDVDIAAIEALLHAYPSNPSDWTPYVRAWTEPDAPYVRNTVDAGNGKYNLVSACLAPLCRRTNDEEQLLLVWRPGAESRIHDHTRHCLMKVLRGALRETVFRFPDEALLRSGAPAPPAVERTRVLCEGEVGYISSACIPLDRWVVWSGA